MTSEKRAAAAKLLKEAEIQAMRAMRLDAQGKGGEGVATWARIMGCYFPTR